MRRTSLVLAVAGGAAVLAVAGAALGVTTADRPAPGTALSAVTAGPTGDDNPKPDDDPTPGGATPSAAAGTAGGAVSRTRAGEIALARAGGGRIVEIEAETEHGRPVWSVKVVDGGIRHEVKVDRGNGAVVEAERERTDDHGGARTRTDDHGRVHGGSDDRYDDHGGTRGRSDDTHDDDHGGSDD
ncbi:PepSY domain-containing protein [Micromonospora eburnea]|uniref:Peptidase propeptide and YPEB domain-containing protein n=1 Tax=Micromonospora eburnea TaxID=227316 RepID=A0A1C6TVN2_9ACTN|nr:PepSY domain-containing protein [Micromonospora eburnea]SCL45748.1 Peptidase propeptide and YPEB domain-containing protein [Micromonospora eburnea]